MFRILFRRKWLVALIVLLVIAGGAAAYYARKQPQGISVTAEGIQRRDLEAIVPLRARSNPRRPSTSARRRRVASRGWG